MAHGPLQPAESAFAGVRPFRVALREGHRSFRDGRVTFTVSARELWPSMNPVDYLQVYYGYCGLDRIESVFGFTREFSPLYGGRPFRRDRALTDEQVERLADRGIGLSLNLTNHFFSEGAYAASLPLLRRHHRSGNSVTCTSDELAARLREDFPAYRLRASIVKELDTLPAVEAALRLYDEVVVPMDRNDDAAFLAALPAKDRVVLFANASCAYTCGVRSCYRGISQEIAGRKVTARCPRRGPGRPEDAHVFFDVARLEDLGYRRFKLVPVAPPEARSAVLALGARKGYFASSIRRRKPVAYVCSYPKCGRTWLRFLLAHYLDLAFGLEAPVDLQRVFALLPNRGDDPVKGLPAYLYPDDARFPLVLFSHHAWDEAIFAAGEKVLLLLRGLPDVVVSDYFHTSRLLGAYPGTLKAFLRDPGGGLDRYCRYLNGWAEREARGGLLTATYEDLHRDAASTLGAALAFLGLAPRGDFVAEAVSRSSFERMQAVEASSGIAGHPDAPEEPEARRVRRGVAGGYADYLDAGDLAYLDARSRELLGPAAVDLLARHDLWPLPGPGRAA